MGYLSIRQRQLEILEGSLQTDFHQKIAQYLREHYPHVVASFNDGQLLDSVATATERAKKYGFEWQSSVLAYVALTFTVGPYFDEHPRIAWILSDTHVSADSRIEYLATAITPDEWNEARAIVVPDSRLVRGHAV